MRSCRRLGSSRLPEQEPRMTAFTSDRPEDEDARPFKPAPILRPRQQVENQLRTAILDGTFARGARLPSETQLAEQLRVSRATVREALRGLAQAGLIRRASGAKGGCFVEDLDHHTLGDLVLERLSCTLELGSISYAEVDAFRNILEIPTVRLAAANRQDHHLAALRDVIDYEKRTTVSDPAISDYNKRLHTILPDSTMNRVLAAFPAALHRLADPLDFIDTPPELRPQAVIPHIALLGAAT